MAERKLAILAEREGSSMTSAWMEYLCLERLANGKLRLFTGRYECIGEASGYYNESTEEFDLPEEIDGKPVVGVEDGEYVIGGELSFWDASEATDFSSAGEHQVTRWMNEQGWSDEIATGDLEEHVRALQVKEGTA